ncbi:MAG: hypothetical protein ACI9VN_002352 [Patescibacteria group bacterium]|jgi:hypothetical protein
MLTKEQLLKYIGKLPDQFSIDELMDKILFLHKVEMGLEQSKNDQVTPHEQVKDRFKKWLK